jgi:cyclic pyranopterin phosphate synthase
MFDRFRRRIHYLRISVTDQCNLACRYCRPADGPPAWRRGPLLSFEEIVALAGTAAALGMDTVRLTGGEPLLRAGIVALVRDLARVRGVRDLAMTTNGCRLAEYAAPLRAAGLRRLNISLDTLDPACFRELSGGGALADVLAGIQAAMDAAYPRIKLNCVFERSPDEPDARQVTEFGVRHGLGVQLIRRMDLRRGRFWAVIGGNGGRCAQCNRLRVSSDGSVFPCLFSDRRYSIREWGIETALRLAIRSKPKSGRRSGRSMYAIGG